MIVSQRRRRRRRRWDGEISPAASLPATRLTPTCSGEQDESIGVLLVDSERPEDGRQQSTAVVRVGVGGEGSSSG